MNLSLYGDDRKGLLRLDPRTKLLILLISAMMSLHCDGSLPVLVYAAVMFTVLALCGKPWAALRGAAVFCIVIYFRACILATPSSAMVISMLASALSTVYLFTFPVLTALTLVIQTTRISQFLAAFQAMHMPMQAVIPLAVLFRFIPTVQEEWIGIRKAMMFRDIRLDIGSILRAPFKTIEYVLIPLLFSSVSVMDEMAAAAMARGMDAEGQRTSYEEVRLHAADYVVMVVFVLLGAYIILGSRLGGVQ